MKTNIRSNSVKLVFSASVLALTFLAKTQNSAAQGTAFTYQGQLQNNGSPAGGIYNFTFTLFTTNTGGTAVAGPVTNSAVAVSNGLFTVVMDFGAAVWNGASNWLQIGVQTNGAGSFTTLTPRQELTPVPYAITAENLDGTVGNGGLSGTYGNPVTFNNGANQFSGTFTGNGSGLTNVNAVTLGGLPAASYWQLGGNATVPTGSNVLGPLGNQFLDIRANGVRALRLRLLTDFLGIYTNAPNVIGGSSVNLTGPNVVGATIAGGGGNETNGSSLFNEVYEDFGTIGGGASNAVEASFATVSGGYQNSANGAYTFVGGGLGNVVNGGYGMVGGGVNNTAGGVGSFVGGGGTDAFTTSGNNAQGSAAAIVGGLANNILTFGAYSFIGGGYSNLVSENYSVVGGGLQNTANAYAATVGGGQQNIAAGPWSFLGGGVLNTAVADYDTIGGGYYNSASGVEATVAGGQQNSASGQEATVSGGLLNGAGGVAATVGGGSFNLAYSTNCTIAGGGNNTANAAYSMVGGGYGNDVESAGAFIGGGGYDGTNFAGNFINSKAATIGGGLGNRIPGGAEYAFIGGGISNTNDGHGSVIGGGGYDGFYLVGNDIQASAAAIVGGLANSIPVGGDYASIGGGAQNTASASWATVGGGSAGTASGEYATVPGGYFNVAQGAASFAAGYSAQALHDYSFVWSDGTIYPSFNSTARSQFLVYAAGGVGIGTNRPQAQLHVASSGGNSFPQEQLDQLNPSDDSRLRFTVGGNVSKRWDLAATTTNFAIFSGSIGANMIFLDSSGLTVRGTFVSSSDRNMKEQFQPVDPCQALEKVAALPITTWSFKDDPRTRHLGPMAQDFHAAFNLGFDDKHIATVDEGGVALAAIQGLNQKLENRSKQMGDRIQTSELRGLKSEARIESLEADNAKLQSQVTDLRSQLETLHKAIAQLTAEHPQ